MNTFKMITKPLMWFMAVALVALAAGCGSGSDPVLNGGGAGSASTKAITAYSLDGFVGAIDESAKTIAVAVPYGTTLTAMVATYTTTGIGVKVGTAVQASAITANDFTLPVVYTVTAGDATTANYTVTVTMATVTSKAITAYSFAGYAGSPGVIDEAAKTIAVTLPYGSNVTALVAQFVSTGTGAPTIGGVSQVSGVTANNFLTSKAYLVTAGDLTTATYTVTVTVASAAAITAYSITGVAGTINEGAKTIAVTLPSGTVVTNLVATFTTSGTGVVTVAAVTQVSGTTPNNFTSPVAYLVTAADASTATYTVTVTLAAANPTAPTMGEAGRFVILANQAVTTTGTTSIRNGDIGITPAARSFLTGFTATGPAGDFIQLTGSTWAGMPSTSYAPADANPAPFPYPLAYVSPHAPYATTGAMLTQASTDLGVANTWLTTDPNPTAPTQVCPTELGGLVLTRGVYKTATNVLISTGTLYLDAQGDSNAVFIFSIGGTLTTGAPGGSIVLMNGAQAKNVFWATGGATVIGAGTVFYGSVFAWTQINVNAGAQITGSLFGITDRVTLIADTITKAP